MKILACFLFLLTSQALCDEDLQSRLTMLESTVNEMSTQLTEQRTEMDEQNVEIRRLGGLASLTGKLPDPSHTRIIYVICVAVMRSCHEYWKAGVTISGLYEIDPDGFNHGEPPFRVYCDFATGLYSNE